MFYSTKWQNDFASKVSSMSDKEIFELIAFEYTCDDRFSKRMQWEYTFLTDTFQFRMGWIKLTLKKDITKSWEMQATPE